MSFHLPDPDDLTALGAFAGAQVLVVIFSAVKANAYRERAYLLHAAATMASVLALQSLAGTQPLFPQVVLLLVMAFAGLQLHDLLSHAGALRDARRWLVGTNLAVMPVLALASAFTLWVLALGLAAWAAVVGWALARAWRQSLPWVWWLLPGMGSLAAAAVSLSWRTLSGVGGAALPVAALLTVWSACVYLGTGWRSRIFGETRVRINARNTVDPLTGLSMPLVLTERVHAARNMVQRYGHPSTLVLVHIEHLSRLSSEFGPEAAEDAVMTGANRIREALREGDVAARLTHSRIAVLAEGISPAEAASNVASRILAAGLREPIPSVPAEFLHFRLLLAPVPAQEVSAKQLLHRMGARLEQELQAPSERRIVTMSNEELVT